MENQRSLCNLTYEPVDTQLQQESYINHSAFRDEASNNQARPESYMDPSQLKNGCNEEENYEDLADIQAKVCNNLYETLPIARAKTQPPERQPNDSELKNFSKNQFDKTEISKIKQDLRQTKICLIIMGLLLLVILLLSTTAVVLAVILSEQTTSAIPPTTIGPQALVAQGNPLEQVTNNTELFNNFSSEVERIYDKLNTSAIEVNSDLRDLTIQTFENLTGIQQAVNFVRDELNVHVNQLQHQLLKSQLNVSLLTTEVLNLQHELRVTQNKIDTVETRISNVSMTQNNLQFRLTTIQTNLSQTSQQVERLQGRISTTENDIVSIRGTVASLQTLQTAIQTNVNTVSTQLNNVHSQLTSAQLSVSLTSSQVTNINNRLRSPVNLYQNCRRDTASCSVQQLINDNRRSYCSTSDLSANITVR